MDTGTPPSLPLLRHIGQGACGSVWADPSSAAPIVPLPPSATSSDKPAAHRQVIKREDANPARSITNEYNMHRRLLASLRHLKDTRSDVATTTTTSGGFRVCFPDSYAFLTPSAPEQEHILSRLPIGYRPCNTLVNERIPPVPLRVRKLLVERTYPQSQWQQILDAEGNRDCIVRVYLGRSRRLDQGTGSAPKFFNLRNFPLHVDQVRGLGLPAEEYAVAMADAMAVVYWCARLDGVDVEFVLAPDRAARPQVGGPSLGNRPFTGIAMPFGDHTMWVLDFDCCHELEMTEDGVKKAARAFLRNDPYFPRPYKEDPGDKVLCELFEAAFLERSGEILEGNSDETRTLPAVFVEEVKRMTREAKGIGQSRNA